MSFSLTAKEATFTKYMSEVMPHLDLLKGFYLLGDSAEASVVNHANKSLPATIIGAPTFEAGAALLSSGANGFNTGITVLRPFTHFGVVSSTGSSAAYMGGWVQADGAGNFVTLLGNFTSLLGVALDGNQRLSSGVAVPAGGAMVFIGATYDGTTIRTFLHNGTELLSASGPYTSSATASKAFRIGASGLSAGASGNFKAAAAGVAQTALTPTQMAAVYAFLKSALARRSVTVL